MQTGLGQQQGTSTFWRAEPLMRLRRGFLTKEVIADFLASWTVVRQKGRTQKADHHHMPYGPRSSDLCAYQLAGNLHPAYGFAPTRLNTADAPSRDKDFPEPAGHSVLSTFSPVKIATLHSFSSVLKDYGQWTRLYLLVVLCLCAGATASSFDRPSFPSLFGLWTCSLALILALLMLSSSQLPHSSLGFSHDFSDAWTSERAVSRRPCGFPQIGLVVPNSMS